MPTTRKRTKRSQSAVMLTPAAIDAYRRQDASALTQELRLPPWWPHPFDASEDEPPEWAEGSPYGSAWPEVRRIRLALEEAAHA